jgi:hypothetical protein
VVKREFAILKSIFELVPMDFFYFGNIDSHRDRCGF